MKALLSRFKASVAVLAASGKIGSFTAWILGLIASAISQISILFTTYFYIRFTFTTIFIGFMIAIILTTFASVNFILSAFTIIMPDAVRTGASWFVPNNVASCFAAITSVRIILWVYSWKKYLLTTYLKTTGFIS
jgi:hypothetical protein